MFNHTRYQMFCSICFKVYEADTIPEALAKVTDHEARPHHVKQIPELQESKQNADQTYHGSD